MMGYQDLVTWLCLVLVQHTSQLSISSIGCWRESSPSTNTSTVTSDDTFRNKPRNASEIVANCAVLARHSGHSIFGVGAHDKCISSVHMGLTYQRYGASRDCREGKGGSAAVNVYSLEGSHPHNYDEDTKKETESKRGFINQPPTLTLDGMQVRLDPQQDEVQLGVRRQFPPVDALQDPLYMEGGLRPVDIQPLFIDIDELKYADIRRVPRGANILKNPSFELPLSSNPVTSWSCQGETDDPRGGVMSQYSHDHHGNGKYSGICLGRLSEWAGPGQYIGRKVKSGGVYQFIGYTKLIDNKKTNDLHSLELWLRFKKRGDKTQHTMRLAIRTKYSTDKGWVKWRTAFQMPSYPASYQYMFLFFKGPKPSVDILLDDVSLMELYQDVHWKDKTDRLIEHYRKRNVKIRINVPSQRYSAADMSQIDIKVTQKKHKFAFGAAVNSDSLVYNHKYRQFFLKHFEWAVLENAMKWTSTEPNKGYHRYKEADKAVAILEKHKISIRGHCIFWAVGDQNPQWVQKSSKRKLMDSIKHRMQNLVTRYRGRLVHWDVNNEMLHGSYFADRLGGQSIREWMFRKAAMLDPDADLFLNEFDVIDSGQLTQAYIEQAKELIRRGITVDGIGVQGHFTGAINPILLRVRLNELSEIKRPIWLTEVDILDHDAPRRAESLEILMRVAFSHPNVPGLILWVFWDNNSWRGKDAALVDGADWQLNAAGRRYVNLLHKWTTNTYLKPSSVDYSGVVAKFRGFHGDYEVSFILPDGEAVTREFTLEPGSSEFCLDIDIHGRPSSSIIPNIWSNEQFDGENYPFYNNTDEEDDDEEQYDMDKQMS